MPAPSPERESAVARLLDPNTWDVCVLTETLESARKEHAALLAVAEAAERCAQAGTHLPPHLLAALARWREGKA